MNATKEQRVDDLSFKFITFINELIEVNNPDISAKKEFPNNEIFLYFLSRAIIAESKKYRINEKADDLLLNAVMSLITLIRDDFREHINETNGIRAKIEANILWRAEFAKQVGLEIARRAKDSNTLKRFIEDWLYNDMDDLLKQLELQTVDFSDCHPMQFYNYLLDMIEKKNTPDYLGIKRLALYRLRVGNAVLNRYEWNVKPSRKNTPSVPSVPQLPILAKLPPSLAKGEGVL
jgi:hypothetical protein